MLLQLQQGGRPEGGDRGCSGNCSENGFGRGKDGGHTETTEVVEVMEVQLKLEMMAKKEQ